MPDLLEQTRAALQSCFGTDPQRLEHTLAVAGWVETLLNYIDADRKIALCAAYLHQVGATEAQRKHQSCAGQFLEIEGPPVVRTLLEQLGAEESLVEHVCELVGRQHTPNGVDSPEFRILWDALALVNLESVAAQKTVEEIADALHNNLRTEPGYRLAVKKYLPDDSLAPHLRT